MCAILSWHAVSEDGAWFKEDFPQLAALGLHAPDARHVDLLDAQLPSSAWDRPEQAPRVSTVHPPPPSVPVGPSTSIVQMNVDVCRRLGMREPMLSWIDHEKGVVTLTPASFAYLTWVWFVGITHLTLRSNR